MNRKKALVRFVIVAMLLCGSLVLSPVRATSSDWSKPRPSGYTLYNETIGNSETNGVASVVVGVEICDYVPKTDGIDYDMLRLRITTSANTRMGIQYDLYEEDYNYQWCNVSEPTGITGDDSGAWLYLGFTFLYYGVEYERVWVCSNGFLTLNKTSTNANPQSIPSMDEPNPVIAVFWRDLHFVAGSSITYGRDVYFNGAYYLVVSWNNVLDDSGTPQTFQVLIQKRSLSDNYHSYIYFQYKSITKSYQTTVGTEDQVGNKGTAYDYNNLHNQACLEFSYTIAGYRLKKLKIKLTKSDGYAVIEVLETRTGGYNVKLKDYSNPWWGDDFEFAIKTTAGLLLWKASIAWKSMLILANLAGVLANDISPVEEEYIKDALEGEDEAWAWGECVIENRSICKPFDSTLATTVEWLFTDANDKPHDLTVTAEAWYEDLSNGYVYIVPTSVTLNMYVGRVLSISASSHGTTDPVSGTYTYDYGSSVAVSATANTYYTFNYWRLDGVKDYSNPITVTMDSDHTLKPYFVYSGGGGGCPILSVYDGTDYFEEGLLDIHNPEGIDVVYQHTLVSTPQRENGAYLLRLTEHPQTHSYIDQVELYAILEDGTMIQLPLIYAWHSEDGNVLPLLRHSDDWKADTLGADLNNGTSQSIDLKFASLSPNLEVTGFMFEIEGNNMLLK